jgi:glucosamine-6-phosphate deaminase
MDSFCHHRDSQPWLFKLRRMESFLAGSLNVEIHTDRAALGLAAARAIAASFQTPLAAIFAAAPSQSETLAALAAHKEIDWTAVRAFHLDEYAGATPDSPHSFRRFLVENLFSKVKIGRFDGLRAESPDLAAECARYAAALAKDPPAVALLGIGENGHLAFNDPPAARFDDPAAVRLVDLTESCRQQQVHDKTFPSLDDVPLQALSVTISRIMQVPALFVMVPGIRKAAAVRDSLQGPVSEDCPASILSTHPNARLFLDTESASLLKR